MRANTVIANTVILTLVVMIVATLAHAQSLPPGFNVENIAGTATFDIPTILAFAPDGRVFVGQKGGKVYIVENGVKLATPFIDLEAEVMSHHDRGLLGMALDPSFAANGHVYFLYTYDHDSSGDYQRTDAVGRLVRYTASALDQNVADPSSRLVLIGSSFPNSIPACYYSHAPGDIHFGSDGTLIMAAGDGASYSERDPGGLYPDCFGVGKLDAGNEDIGAFRSQHTGSYAGKILRVDAATGNGLPSNPFYTGDVTDIESKVWAYGLRNPFRFGIRPNGSSDPNDGNPGSIYIGDVGWGTWEETNVAGPGGGQNFGWPCFEGPNPHAGYQGETPAHHDCSTIGTASNPSNETAPTTYWHHNDPGSSFPSGVTGSSSTGGDFYEGNRYPAAYHHHYYYSDYIGGWIKMLVVDADDNFVQQVDFASSLGGVVDLQYNPYSGHLYYIDIFNGAAMRIYHTGGESNGAPVALAAATPTGGAPPLGVQFTGSGSSDPDGDPLTYLWDFGDGDTTSTADPYHTYTTGGAYTARLTVTDFYGVTAADSIVIDVGAPGANFAADSLAGTSPLTVNFTDLSTLTNPVSWSWDFGDGGGSSERHPQHTYTKMGAFTVSLTVVGDEGSVTNIKEDCIVVGVPGVRADYFDDLGFSGDLMTRVENRIHWRWDLDSPDPSMGADSFTVRWTGWVRAEYDETYTFYTRTDDGVRLWVDGVLLVDKWQNQSITTWTGDIALKADSAYEVTMEFYEDSFGANAELDWSSSSTPREDVPDDRWWTLPCSRGTGDVDASRRISPGDVACAFDIFLAEQAPVGGCDASWVCELSAGDMNCDGIVTPRDALAIEERVQAGLGPSEGCAVSASSPPPPFELAIHQTPITEDGTDKLLVTLATSNVNGLQAFGMRLLFPDSDIQFERIDPTVITGGWMMLDAKEVAPGELMVGGFSLAPAPESFKTEIFRVIFTYTGAVGPVGGLDAVDFVDDFFGASVVGSITGARGPAGPDRYRLLQNHPNPFNPTTLVEFDIPASVAAVGVTLDVYDVRGKFVHRLVDGLRGPGRHVAHWDGTDRSGREVPSGVYFYMLRAGGFSDSKRMVLLK